MMREIECHELKQRLDRGDDIKLVNMLDEHAFRAMRIPGSLHFTSLEAMTAALQSDDEIIVYCTGRVCMTSIKAYHVLKRKGYQNVTRFSGGLEAWAVAGYPLEGEQVS
jgi:adenylyltransferase/sulfurtransferase